MPTVTLNPADVANAQLGIDLPVIYGSVRGQGNEILNHALPNKNRIVIRILSEGEIDGIDRLFINGTRANEFDTNLIHFHPGIDGELGHGLTPDSNGGDQRVDNFWSLLPGNFQPTTFSRKAYIMLNVPPDPAAPSATLTVAADYRGMVLRQFDGFGAQTGYSFSTNGAEQCLDAILRTMLKPEWNPSAARAAGGDLVAAEKARVNWSSLADSVSWCNTLLANGQKRFESSIAFVQRTGLIDALKQLCLMSQLYIIEANGQIYICPDKPRVSTFILKSDHVVAGSASFDKINLRGAPNRFIASYNDLNAQGIADIDTVANSGLLRSGTGLVTVQTKTSHPFSIGQTVQVIPPTDGSTHDGAFDGLWLINAKPAANKFQFSQAGNYNALMWSEDFSNTVWQRLSGATVTANNQTDPLGGSTADTVTSGTGGQSLFQPIIFNSVNGLPWTFSIWLKAASSTSVTLQISRPGADLEQATITVTNVWQRFTFTHSGTWTGSGRVQAILSFAAATSIFCWGAQLEDGTVATVYRQTTNSNFLLWSEQLENAVYVYTLASAVANNQTDPNGGSTADTVTSAATGSAWGFRQTSALNAFSGMPVTLSIWLKAASNLSVVLQLTRNLGSDVENVTVNVTTAWQRFTFTHSGTWTGTDAIVFAFGFLAINTSVFVWGAQMEEGSVAGTYLQTTSTISQPPGFVSGNGNVGTPESRYAVRSVVVDHEQHQNAIGQRGLSLTPIFRVVPLSLNMGNNTYERVKRILNFLSARNLGVPTTPYSAPWSGTVTCFMDAVDINNKALISQLPGDIISVDATVSEEYQADYEITKAVYVVPAADGSSNSGSSGQSNRATIELTLLQYLAAAFSDTSSVTLSLRASITSGLAPLAQVDSLGVQRLASTKQNNPTNVASYFTGGNPLSQSGSSSTILVSSFTIQYGFGQVSYNSGSVNPGSLGTWTVYTRDPQFTGGAVTYFAVLSTSQSTLTSFDDVVCVGTIVLTGGGGAHGTGGGGGACFSGNVKVRVPGGLALLEELDPVCVITTEFGPRMADVIVTEYSGEMRDMGDRKLVTPGHLIQAGPGWLPASMRWERVVCFEGKVYTLRVHTEIDDERHFILEDGTKAHNISPPPQ